MLLATKRHTVGDRRKHIVDYTGWLQNGQWLTNATAVSSSSTLTVDGVAVKEGHEVWLFTNGGLIGETATITVTVTVVDTEVRNDTIVFTVAAP